ncbi:MAG: hypothetical protein L0Z49_12840, partial [Actinobacteria bacterium]|nr:hypothetical protein [Actinomycetota bacterium]
MLSFPAQAASFLTRRTGPPIDAGSKPLPAGPAIGKRSSTSSIRSNEGRPTLLASVVSAAIVLAGGSSSQCPPDACGRWSPLIHLWEMAGNTDCPPNFNPSVIEPCDEIAHLTLIPVGPKQGWVHFWRATTVRPQVTQIWRPDGTDVFDLVVRTPACPFPTPPPGPQTCYYGPNCPPLDCGNVFCSGHAYLPDGRLVTGGADELCSAPPIPPNTVFGSRESWVFDPNLLTGATPPSPPGWWEPWSQVGPMPLRGWYPSLLALPNGDILRVGGTVDGCNPITTYAQELMILKWNAGVPGPWLIPLDVATGNQLLATDPMG